MVDYLIRVLTTHHEKLRFRWIAGDIYLFVKIWISFALRIHIGWLNTGIIGRFS